MIVLSIICIIAGLSGILLFSSKHNSMEAEYEFIEGRVLSAKNNRFYTAINLTYCTTKKVSIEKKDKDFVKTLAGKNVRMNIVNNGGFDDCKADGKKILFSKNVQILDVASRRS